MISDFYVSRKFDYNALIEAVNCTENFFETMETDASGGN